MLEAAMIWNEPNNKSHWDPEIDPDWSRFGELVKAAAKAIHAVNPQVKRVLGGISPIDPLFIQRMTGYGVLEHLDVIAVHGFPLDWNLWPIHEWPNKIAEIEAVAPNHEIWATEVGVGSFGAEEVQVFGVDRTAELLVGRVPRIFWYSLFDLPQAWGATTRHREAEGSSYYRHFYMGLIREDGTPKLALEHYAKHAQDMGLMQWFHYHDPRLDDAVAWMKRLGVRHLRTGLSWADSFRPDALGWFDRQMEALQDFETTVTFCFTPEHLGLAAHHTSAPHDPNAFADFCAQMIERYAPAQPQRQVA
jgi:beta-xylosidase